MSPGPILECALARWSVAFGDPNAMGWVTVAAYALAAGLSLAAAASGRFGATSSPERAFWAIAGLGMVFLAVNKQLDLQSFFTVAGRCAAQLQGWYGMRRVVQLEFILALIGACLAGGLVAFWLLRGTLRRTGIALLGLVWITGFVLVRAAGFHHVDKLIGLRVAEIRLNWIFELGGIGLFVLGVMLARSSPARREADR